MRLARVQDPPPNGMRAPLVGAAAGACVDGAGAGAGPALHGPGARDAARADALDAADALNLYAQALSARTAQACAHALVASLASSQGFVRATIAVHESGRTQLLASSQPEGSTTGSEWAQRTLGAMNEALDQAVSIGWPGDDDAAAGQALIRIEHEALHRLVGGAIATVPIGAGGEPFAVLCVQRDGARPFACDELARLERLVQLAGPALRWMRRAEASWARRMRADLVRVWSRLRQPDRRTQRRLIAGAALGVLFLAVAPLQRDVSGRARVEGAEQRVLVAPSDGFIKRAHVRPGDRVKAGDALVDLLDGDLRLERERWASQLAQHENAYAAAMAKADRTTAATSMARVAEAQSQLALVDEQLVRGRLEAPFDALVIQGDLSQSIGAPVRLGDTLLTLATTGRHRVIVEIDEIDIGRVRPGQPGQLALSSVPWHRQDLVVERITPLAKAVDGRNVFEVEARLLAAQPDLRPGLLGRAEIAVGRLPPLWAWTAHAIERARVAWWAWLG